MLSFSEYTTAISILTLAKITMSRRTLPNSRPADEIQTPIPSTPLTNNRHLLHVLALDPRRQDLIPSASLVKALKTFLYKEDKSLATIWTLDGDNPDVESFMATTTALLQILLSQTFKYPTTFCSDEHEKYFTSLLSGAKIYVRYRDKLSVDQSELHSEDLTNFYILMTFFLASADSTDNRLNEFFSTEETFKTILSEQGKYSLDTNDIIASIIELEKKIATKLKEAYSIPNVLTFVPTGLADEEYKELESEFPLLCLYDDKFTGFWTESYLESIKDDPSLTQEQLSAKKRPDEALGQSMLYSVFLANLDNSTIISHLTSVTDFIETSFACLMRICTAKHASKSKSWVAFNNLLKLEIEPILMQHEYTAEELKNLPTKMITSLITYIRTLKFAECRLTPDKTIKDFESELLELEGSINDVFLRSYRLFIEFIFVKDVLNRIKPNAAKRRQQKNLLLDIRDLFSKIKKIENHVLGLYNKYKIETFPETTLNDFKRHEENIEQKPDQEPKDKKNSNKKKKERKKLKKEMESCLNQAKETLTLINSKADDAAKALEDKCKKINEILESWGKTDKKDEHLIRDLISQIEQDRKRVIESTKKIEPSNSPSPVITYPSEEKSYPTEEISIAEPSPATKKASIETQLKIFPEKENIKNHLEILLTRIEALKKKLSPSKKQKKLYLRNELNHIKQKIEAYQKKLSENNVREIPDPEADSKIKEFEKLISRVEKNTTKVGKNRHNQRKKPEKSNSKQPLRQRPAHPNRQDSNTVSKSTPSPERQTEKTILHSPSSPTLFSKTGKEKITRSTSPTGKGITSSETEIKTPCDNSTPMNSTTIVTPPEAPKVKTPEFPYSLFNYDINHSVAKAKEPPLAFELPELLDGESILKFAFEP
jgi:hypothetical protein